MMPQQQGQLVAERPGERGGGEFLNIKQVADFLQLNEKKIYSMVSEGVIPATKITGKWLFPKRLVERWLLESCHGGVLADRLLVVGSGDLLLQQALSRQQRDMQDAGLVSMSVTGTRLGLAMLDRGRADLCVMHWGPAVESRVRHPALLQRYRNFRQWAMVRLFEREVGIAARPGVEPTSAAACLGRGSRWALRQGGSGARRLFDEQMAIHHRSLDELEVGEAALSEWEVAVQLNEGRADYGILSRACARQLDLPFLSLGSEALDMVVPQPIYFRVLVQQMMAQFRTQPLQQQAAYYGGYDLGRCGEILWTP
ncbi:helix-turn-helix transcriptional regulator [Aestuariirhabdus litorea]|uniref:Helix-turn-helix domain-containing protein n=1 Tax=Aestuariirhabdus litorea TaxID=2528527 RepID=A0A3P3VNP8_9GAMM|nr:helix-turn-helix transcriptional regulator [Aestuariirhabdus litorea]RRJ83967.1 helix-turn-helix domain-containing protein [Aestuariirhabdus litorea]RWW97187.1 helix-turn-helix domain-containing protein [Endozoicomonadaceae bacterium GTF-13]